MQHGFRNFFNELSRRGVLKAGGFYLAGGWVLIQVADVVLQPLGMAPWMLNLLIWLVVIGFPFTLLFSWRYDVSSEGISLTPPPTLEEQRNLALSRGDFFALAVAAVLVGVLALFLAEQLRQQQAEVVSSARHAPPVSKNSIAVLPFENLGGDTDRYLGQGLAEDILHRLASIPGLQVASRTASFELDRSNLGMAEIGGRLGVRNVLEGSVRREGDRVRIVAQLIDTYTGYHVWSQRYDRHLEDLFRIYDEISTALTTELQLTLAPEAELIQPPPTVDMQAYDYFLQARSILQRASQAGNVANAQRFFANAVEIDPAFAEAWAGQCRAFLEWYEFDPSPALIESAEASCRRALGLDPGLASGLVALGDLYRIIGAYEQAVVQYQQAFRSNPDLAIAWRGIGQAFDALGRGTEAQAALEKATQLDENDLLNWYALGNFHMDHGRYQQGSKAFERMANHPRADASAFNAVGWARAMLGDFGGAAEAFRQVIALEPTAVAYSNVGVMYYINGNFDAAVVMLREAVGLDPNHPVNWANLGDALRETPGGQNEALAAYRRAAELSEQVLAVNPRDAEMRTNLAHCLARLGDDARASEMIEQVLRDVPDDPYAHYYHALVQLEAGRHERALEAVRQAVAYNFPVAQLRSDPQFAALRGLPEFDALLVNPSPGE